MDIKYDIATSAKLAAATGAFIAEAKEKRTKGIMRGNKSYTALARDENIPAEVAKLIYMTDKFARRPITELKFKQALFDLIDLVFKFVADGYTNTAADQRQLAEMFVLSDENLQIVAAVFTIQAEHKFGSADEMKAWIERGYKADKN